MLLKLPPANQYGPVKSATHLSQAKDRRLCVGRDALGSLGEAVSANRVPFTEHMQEGGFHEAKVVSHIATDSRMRCLVAPRRSHPGQRVADSIRRTLRGMPRGRRRGRALSRR